MSLFTRTYTPTDLTTEEGKAELNAHLLEIKNVLNHLDDLNFPAGGEPIDPSKIADGSMLTAHASRHAVGGADSLKASSVCGAMIQPRAINGGHLQLGSILAEHLAFADSIASLIYIDENELTAQNGDTITGPVGYTNFRVLLLGFSVSSSAEDKGIRQVVISMARGVDSYAVTCYAVSEDESSQVDGEVYYVRLAWN